MVLRGPQRWFLTRSIRGFEWLGEVVKVDVESNGLARGKYLHVRAQVSVHEPLVRGFYLRLSPRDEEKTWYDFS